MQSQIDHIQRVLDAAVVNPVLQKEHQRLLQQSITAQSGALVVYDPRKVREADKVAERLIHVSEADKRIRLHHESLLLPDALKARTDNPDESAYLNKIRNTLNSRGVWLNFDNGESKEPGSNRYFLDPRKFVFWLSVGPNGDHIPTKTGMLTQEDLLATTKFGAGYFTEVYQGEVQRTLEREYNRLSSEIDDGIYEHQYFIRRRSESPIVGKFADFIGEADLPDISIWDLPNRFLKDSKILQNNGNFNGSKALLIAAAVATQDAVQEVKKYIEKSQDGAATTVKYLKIATTAAAIVELGLILVTPVSAARIGSMALSKSGKDSIDEVAKFLNDYIKKNPDIARELNSVRVVPGPRGNVIKFKYGAFL